LPDARSRLIRCFSVVFPNLEEQEIPISSVASVGDWDSLASINIYSLVEEEFGIEISMEDLENLLSFELILEFIEGGTGVF
jgi:acyl carrier protein